MIHFIFLSFFFPPPPFFLFSFFFYGTRAQRRGARGDATMRYSRENGKHARGDAIAIVRDERDARASGMRASHARRTT